MKESLEPLIAQLQQYFGDDPNRRFDLFSKLLGEGTARQIGLARYPEGWKLSVVIPVYNEDRWIEGLIERVQAVPVPKEIICVNDKSTDNSAKILDELAARHANMKVFH